MDDIIGSIAPLNETTVHMSHNQMEILLDAVVNVVAVEVHDALRDYRGDDVARVYDAECHRVCEDLAAVLRRRRWQFPLGEHG